MKKILLFALVIAVAFAFAGCDDGVTVTNWDDMPTNSDVTNWPSVYDPTPAPQPSGVGVSDLSITRSTDDNGAANYRRIIRFTASIYGVTESAYTYYLREDGKNTIFSFFPDEDPQNKLNYSNATGLPVSGTETQEKSGDIDKFAGSVTESALRSLLSGSYAIGGTAAVNKDVQIGVLPYRTFEEDLEYADIVWSDKFSLRLNP